jgi:glutaredoxin 3
MKAVVWSKAVCPYCVSAKTLLKQKGYEIEERVIGNGFSKEQLLESVPAARTVPQIFIDDKYVGGYDDLVKYFENNSMKTSVQKQWNVVFNSDNEAQR